MPTDFASQLEHLPPEVSRLVALFLEKLDTALGEELSSVVLFGSAAEGAFRSTSDVNLLIVLRTFQPEKMDSVREPYRIAESAVQLHALFLLERELPEASEQFGVKFADILRRRKVLYGKDPFAAMTLPREAIVRRARQVLLNQLLRLRAQYLSRSLRSEQAVQMLAEAAGPLRSTAAAVLEAAGRGFTSQKEALVMLSKELPGSWDSLLANISHAREERVTDGDPALRVAELIRFVEALHDHLQTHLVS